ncbi:MAG: hypothetical protein A3J38_00970 [Gammaproteobacteria bacterium RIFCSPHIGHO2_12_FULL_45_9]|nr:MAG: hypothetical protein A3J38_00970 [Gammaproteobacteria bacterium RIFCSPHIGHO2_12_FULL_45_9]
MNISLFLKAWSSCVRTSGRPLCYLRFSIQDGQKRGLKTSFAGTPDSVKRFMDQSTPVVKDMIMKNDVILPDFSARGRVPLYQVGQHRHPLLQQLSPDSKVVPVVAVASLSKQQWRESLTGIQQLGSVVRHVLIVKGYHPDDIRSDPHIDTKYIHINNMLQDNKIETAAVLNIHEPPSAIERELSFKHSLGFTTYYTQPVYDPMNTLPTATLEHITNLVRQGIGLKVGLFLPHAPGYVGRKLTPMDSRIADSGADRYLMPSVDAGEDLESDAYAQRVLVPSITWAKLMKSCSPAGNVDVYTRIGLNAPNPLIFQLLSVHGTEFDLSNIRKPAPTGDTAFITI